MFRRRVERTRHLQRLQPSPLPGGLGNGRVGGERASNLPLFYCFLRRLQESPDLPCMFVAFMGVMFLAPGVCVAYGSRSPNVLRPPGAGGCKMNAALAGSLCSSLP